MSVDKNQAIIDFLMTSPQVQQFPLYFNAINVTDKTRQIVTQGNDITLNKSFINGSIQKRYVFTLIDFRSVSYNPLVTVTGYSNENVDEVLDIQGLMNWVNEQGDNYVYPNFGDGYVIEAMKTLSNNPILNGIDTSGQQAIAKYSFSIQIDYIDNTKSIF